MNILSQTIYRLCGASILCTVIQALSKDWKIQKQTVSLICSLLMLAILLQPISTIIPANLSALTGIYQEEASELVSSAVQDTKTELSAVISEQAAAYIMDKASQLGANLEVTVQTDDAFLPCEVCITGAVSPYARTRLERILEQDMGIPKSRQEWCT